MKTKCINIEMFVRYIKGNLSSQEKEEMEYHLSVCNRCRKELVSAYNLIKESDVFEWEPASDEEVRSVSEHLNKPGHLKQVYEWIIKQLTPDVPLQPRLAVRDSYAVSYIEFIEFPLLFPIQELGTKNNLHLKIYIEKTENNKVNIKANLITENINTENIRLTFKREGGGTVSRLLKGDYAFFEELRLGEYRFSLKQHGAEKGACFIHISESEIEVNDALS